jgi:hypothetical protein
MLPADWSSLMLLGATVVAMLWLAYRLWGGK